MRFFPPLEYASCVSILNIGVKLYDTSVLPSALFEDGITVYDSSLIIITNHIVMCIYVIGGNDSDDVVTVPDYLRTDVFESMARFQINSDTCDRWRNVVLIHADVPIGALKVLVRIMDDFTNELQGLILEYGVEAIMFAQFLQIDDKHIYRLAHRIALLTTELDDIIKLKRIR